MNPDVCWNIVIDKENKTLSIMMTKGNPTAGYNYLSKLFNLDLTECLQRFSFGDTSILSPFNKKPKINIKMVSKNIEILK